VDELIKGRRTLRTDSLERLEMMTVQLEEAKALIERDTVIHARLAFILLDNAAEVLMRRSVEVLLSGNRRLEEILRQWEEILEHTDNPEARCHRDEVKQDVVPRGRRAELARLFPAKVDFLEERGCIEATVGRVLKKLHQYRNELYHREHLRLGTIRTACLVYFDIACSFFESLKQYDWIIVKLHMKPPPVLAKYNPPGTATGYPTEGMIAQQLRSGLGIIEADSLKQILIDHLISRLDELERNIERAQRELFAGFSEILPMGPWKDAIVRLSQVHEDGLPESLEDLLNANLRYRVDDLTQWRQAVADLQSVEGKLELFAGFADIEDSFEEFEAQVNDLEVRIQLEVQMAEEIRRGK